MAEQGKRVGIHSFLSSDPPLEFIRMDQDRKVRDERRGTKGFSQHLMPSKESFYPFPVHYSSQLFFPFCGPSLFQMSKKQQRDARR